MDILCEGPATMSTPHPADPKKNNLYLVFDQCHIINNVKSQFLDKEIGGKKEISSAPLKQLYMMQQGSTVKPVRFLTRKHLYASNIEKMSVRPGVQIFSPLVTAALQHMKIECTRGVWVGRPQRFFWSDLCGLNGGCYERSGMARSHAQVRGKALQLTTAYSAWYRRSAIGRGNTKVRSLCLQPLQSCLCKILIMLD